MFRIQNLILFYDGEQGGKNRGDLLHGTLHKHLWRNIHILQLGQPALGPKMRRLLLAKVCTSGEAESPRSDLDQFRPTPRNLELDKVHGSPMGTTNFLTCELEKLNLKFGRHS